MVSLDISGLDIDYGTTRVVHDADIAVPSGTFHTLLGPSGSGKTTILRAVAGFVTPSAGAIRLDDRDIIDVPTQRRRIGIVFQSYALFPHLSVFDNVAFGLQVQGADKQAQRDKVDDLLELVRLQGLQDRAVDQLSGGQQQRVALARALALDPVLLLLDEPMSALDRKIRAQVQEELREVQRATGVTTVMVTHDQDEAMALSDDVTVLQDGRVEQSGPPREVYHRPATAFVADFLGSANVVTLPVDGGVVRLLGAQAAADGHPDGTRVSVSVRAEHLQIGTATGTDADHVVERVTATGAVLDVRLSPVGAADAAGDARRGLRALVMAHDHEDLDVGSVVSLAVTDNRLHVMGETATAGAAT